MNLKKSIAIGSVAAASVFAAVYASDLSSPTHDKAYANGPVTAMTIARAVGAADGMIEGGWKNPDLESRIDAVRPIVPERLGQKGFEHMSAAFQIEIVSVKEGARQEAIAGMWSEEALDGFLQVAELSPVRYMEASLKTSSGDNRFAAPLNYDEALGRIMSRDVERGLAKNGYAAVALAQNLSLESRILHFMAPALAGDYASSEEMMVNVNARRGEMSVEVLSGMASASGFYSSPDVSLDALTAEMSDARAEAERFSETVRENADQILDDLRP